MDARLPHLAFGNFAQRRDDFAVIGFEQWLGTFEKLFCSLGARPG